ncbi:MAG: DUF6783 domain-containing protein [Oliverpabstia sp.]
MFYPHSVAVARYAALIRIKSPTNWDSQLTKSLLQTRSRTFPCEISVEKFRRVFEKSGERPYNW